MLDAGGTAAPDPPPAGHDPLRDPAVRALTAAQVVSGLLYGLVIPFLPGHAEALGLTGTGIGLLFAVYGIGSVAATLILVEITDRVPPVHIFVASIVGLTLATLVFASGSTSLTALFIARVVQGLGAGALYGIVPALVAHRYGVDARGQAMGIVSAGGSFGTLLGPMVGGALYGIGGWSLPFLVLAGAVVIVAVPCIRVVGAMPGAVMKRNRRYAFGDLLKSPAVRPACFALAGGVTLIALFEPLVPLWLDARFDVDELTIGLIFGGIGLAFGGVTPFVGAWSDRVRPRLRMATLGFVLVAVTVPLGLLSTSLAFAALVLALIGAALAVVLVPTTPAFADAIDEVTDHQGVGPETYVLGTALNGVIYGTGLALGPTLGGLFVDSVGLDPTLWATSGVAVFFAWALHRLLARRQARR